MITCLVVKPIEIELRHTQSTCVLRGNLLSSEMELSQLEVYIVFDDFIEYHLDEAFHYILRITLNGKSKTDARLCNEFSIEKWDSYKKIWTMVIHNVSVE